MNDSTPFAVEVVRSALKLVTSTGDVDVDDLDPDVDIWAELNLDSLDHLTVMEHLSYVTDRDVPESEYPRLLSLRQLRAHVADAVT